MNDPLRPPPVFSAPAPAPAWPPPPVADTTAAATLRHDLAARLSGLLGSDAAGALRKLRGQLIFGSVVVAVLELAWCVITGAQANSLIGGDQSMAGAYDALIRLLSPWFDSVHGVYAALSVAWWLLAFSVLRQAGRAPVRPIRWAVLLAAPFVSVLFWVPLNGRLWRESTLLAGQPPGGGGGRLLLLAVTLLLQIVIAVSWLGANIGPLAGPLGKGQIVWALFSCVGGAAEFLLYLLVIGLFSGVTNNLAAYLEAAQAPDAP